MEKAQKRITITQNRKAWDINFEGLVSRKDILKIQRLNIVAHAKHMRKYSQDKRRADLLRFNTESNPELQKDESNVARTS